jgi:site-specific recombinase XerD
MSKGTLRVIEKEGRYRLTRDKGAVVDEVDRFLTALEIRGLSSLTVRAYAFDLLVLYRFLHRKNQSIKELKQSDLLDFVCVQQQLNARPTSINRRLVVACLLYRFLTGEDISSCVGASLPARYYKGRGKDRELGLHSIKAPRYRSLRVKTPRTLVEPLTVKQTLMLISSFKRYRDIAIIYLMLLCGLRSREVLALEIRDVGFEENRLCVPGKGNKERILPLPTILLTCLRDYIRLERPSYCRTNTLFVILQGKNRGRPMTSAGLRSLFRHRRQKEIIKMANPHRLRHTFGADMARCGVRLPILQKMMGHTDSQMTLQYINLSMTDIAKEFERATKEIQKRYTK